jgi:hypothetical protein
VSDETPKWIPDKRPPASRAQRQADGTYGETLSPPEQRLARGAATEPVKAPPIHRKPQMPQAYHQRVRRQDVERLGLSDLVVDGTGRSTINTSQEAT